MTDFKEVSLMQDKLWRATTHLDPDYATSFLLHSKKWEIYPL
jgi:hypothetical protein